MSDVNSEGVLHGIGEMLARKTLERYRLPPEHFFVEEKGFKYPRCVQRCRVFPVGEEVPLFLPNFIWECGAGTIIGEYMGSREFEIGTQQRMAAGMIVEGLKLSEVSREVDEEEQVFYLIHGRNLEGDYKIAIKEMIENGSTSRFQEDPLLKEGVVAQKSGGDKSKVNAWMDMENGVFITLDKETREVIRKSLREREKKLLERHLLGKLALALMSSV